MIKRHSKQEFCELIVMGLFSSNLLSLIAQCLQQMKNLFLVSLVSLVPDIFFILGHICWLIEVSFCLKRNVSCGKCLTDMSKIIQKSIKY